MVTLDSLRGNKRSQLLQLAEKHGARNLRVFGSVARGESTETSDLDLLVDMEPGRTLFDLAGFAADVQDLIGARVDVATPGGLRYLRERVLREAIPL
jgi:hypothetical protein